MANTKENRPPATLQPPRTPIRPHSPSARPLLALQRDHSACANISSPLLVRKTRDNTLDISTEIPPPCHGCVVMVPERQKSVSRRVLSAVKQGLSRSDASLRTTTCSTISTTDLVTDFGSTKLSDTPYEPQVVSTVALPQEGHNTQLSSGSWSFQTPYVDLQVTTDVGRVDIDSKQDIWIAISATVRLHTVHLFGSESMPTSTPRQTVGNIPSLRLLFQPAPRHRVLQALGHKSAKQMKPGDSCDLFVRLRIPKYQATPAGAESELDVLFADLESTLGTLESEILYVEARYKHTMMEESNSVLVRRTAKVKRYKPDSRYSVEPDRLVTEPEDTHQVVDRKAVHSKMSKWVGEHASPLGPPWM